MFHAEVKQHSRLNGNYRHNSQPGHDACVDLLGAGPAILPHHEVGFIITLAFIKASRPGQAMTQNFVKHTRQPFPAQSTSSRKLQNGSRNDVDGRQALSPALTNTPTGLACCMLHIALFRSLSRIENATSTFKPLETSIRILKGHSLILQHWACCCCCT